MTTETPLRVIIIGSGPSGLFLAHCLDKTDVDFVILEKRKDVIEASGASIGMWPQSARIFQQLGLLEEMEKVSSLMIGSSHLNPDGSELVAEKPLFEMIRKAHGYDF